MNKALDDSNQEWISCFLNLQPLAVMSCLITMQNIATHQANDYLLLQERNVSPLRYPTYRINNVYIICRQDTPGDWKIVIPPTLIDSVIYWYQFLLGHCGATKLAATIRDWFWALDLLKKIKAF